MKLPQKHIAKSGFTVPKDYFETMGESMFKNASGTNSALDSLQTTKSGFTVPDNYFENLTDSIVKNSKLKKSDKKLFYLKKTQLALISGIAALFILMFTLSKFSSQPFSINDLTVADIENYFGEDPIDYENYQSYLYSTTEELTNTMSFSAIQDNSIENYLLLEEIQVELLIQY
ncbi:hypothetical protein ACE939_07790 [Aquimarina sp. W85]|uniref:hypothetical protein n=1 Tax=Aquimarina rhodophyticola TaxID=3342246 RepID=UPI00366A675A